MEYNEQGLQRLVKGLGLTYEVERLQEAGLKPAQLAEVFDSILNPESPGCFLLNPKSPDRFPVYKRVLGRSPKTQAVSYRMLSGYFGIGTSQDHSIRSISITLGFRASGDYRLRVFCGALHAWYPHLFLEPQSVWKPLRNRIAEAVYQRSIKKILGEGSE